MTEPYNLLYVHSVVWGTKNKIVDRSEKVLPYSPPRLSPRRKKASTGDSQGFQAMKGKGQSWEPCGSRSHEIEHEVWMNSCQVTQEEQGTNCSIFQCIPRKVTTEGVGSWCLTCSWQNKMEQHLALTGASARSAWRERTFYPSNVQLKRNILPLILTCRHVQFRERKCALWEVWS